MQIIINKRLVDQLKYALIGSSTDRAEQPHAHQKSNITSSCQTPSITGSTIDPAASRSLTVRQNGK